MCVLQLSRVYSDLCSAPEMSIGNKQNRNQMGKEKNKKQRNLEDTMT